jgi:cation transport protein ChaC
MLLGSYRPTWLRFRNERGTVRKALTFCVDPLGPGYAGNACETEIIAALRLAKGRYGTCLTYVNDTVEALRAHGITDGKLNALLARACNVKRIG